MEILIPILAVTAIGLVCAVGLSAASHVMRVKEDDRFSAVRECLPGANCGACGYSGCDGYAKALLKGAKPNLCIPGAAETARNLSALLGVEAEAIAPKRAVVHCSGACQADSVRTDYHGIRSCAAAKLFFGGAGSCVFGCMGLGDCESVCPNDAICLTAGIAVIDPARCTGCGVCAKNCPQKIIEVLPADVKVSVNCSNRQKGAVTRRFCAVGCIGCGKCERNCTAGAITVSDHLASIDPARCTGCGKCAENCPANCIRVYNGTASLI